LISVSFWFCVRFGGVIVVASFTAIFLGRFTLHHGLRLSGLGFFLSGLGCIKDTGGLSFKSSQLRVDFSNPNGGVAPLVFLRKFGFESISEVNTNLNLVDDVLALFISQPVDLSKLVLGVDSKLVHLCETLLDFAVEYVAFFNGLNNGLESLNAGHVVIVGCLLACITVDEINDFLDAGNKFALNCGVHMGAHLALNCFSVLVGQGLKLVLGLLPVEELAVLIVEDLLDFLVFCKGLGE